LLAEIRFCETKPIGNHLLPAAAALIFACQATLNHQPDTADPPPRTRPPSLSMATTRSVAEPSDIIGHWPFFSAKQEWW
jgi:hypothetical protein